MNKRKNKYVMKYDNFLNCPIHDGSYESSELYFFSSIKELLAKILEAGINDICYEYNVYYTSGHLAPIDIGYISSGNSHTYQDVVVRVKYLKMRIVDNGSGKKEWVRE